MMKSKLIVCIVTLLSLPLSHLRAEQTGDTLNINFEGHFTIATPCTVSDDKVMDISFGNVGVNKVNGTDFSRPIPYTVDCHGAPDSSPVNLKVSGTAVNFDNAAVLTSANGLGIQIQANGQPMKLNESLVTTLGGLQSVTLTAVPVKDPAVTLTEQTFTATATLTADYQ